MTFAAQAANVVQDESFEWNNDTWAENSNGGGVADQSNPAQYYEGTASGETNIVNVGEHTGNAMLLQVLNYGPITDFNFSTSLFWYVLWSDNATSGGRDCFTQISSDGGNNLYYYYDLNNPAPANDSSNVYLTLEDPEWQTWTLFKRNFWEDWNQTAGFPDTESVSGVYLNCEGSASANCSGNLNCSISNNDKPTCITCGQCIFNYLDCAGIYDCGVWNNNETGCSNAAAIGAECVYMDPACIYMGTGEVDCSIRGWDEGSCEFMTYAGCQLNGNCDNAGSCDSCLDEPSCSTNCGWADCTWNNLAFGEQFYWDLFTLNASESEPEFTEISDCTNITDPGEYRMGGDIIKDTTENCIVIRTSGVIFDGQGFLLYNTGIATGIYSGYSDISIKNVGIEGWGTGIHVDDQWTNNVTDCNFTSNTIGLNIAGDSQEDYISGNRFEDNVQDIQTSSNSGNNFYLDNVFVTSIGETTADFFGLASSLFIIDGFENPPRDPPGLYNINKYLNVSLDMSDGREWIFLNISYEEADLGDVNESTLEMKKYSDQWYNASDFASDYGVDTVNNVVYANITNFSSGFAPMGDLSDVLDTTAPTYSNQGTNTTIAGTAIKFYILYNDETALNPNGGYIFSTNNTGSWTNESYVSWGATPSWANVTKTLNSTVGLKIGYRWYANDSAGNRNDTSIFTLTTTSSDSSGPTFSNNQTNSTYAGQFVKHSILVNDDNILENAGQYVFSFDNCTGSFANDSAANFTSTPQWVNVTKGINSTVNCTIQWKVYAKDNAGNWNVSSTFAYNATNASAGITIVSACGTISSPGYYQLNQTVHSNGTCFTIDSDNVIFDCQDFAKIVYFAKVNSNSYGFFVSSRNNFTLLNCQIIKETLSTINSRGIYLEGVDNSVISTNSISTTNTGSFDLSMDVGSSNNRIINNSFATSGDSSSGFYFYSGCNCNNNSFINNTITTSGTSSYGFDIKDSANLTLQGNNVTTSGGQAMGLVADSITDSNFTSNRLSCGGSGGTNATIKDVSALYFSSSSRNRLNNNTITITASAGNFGGEYFYDSNNNTIYGETVDTGSNGNSPGIYLSNTNNTIINRTSVTPTGTDSPGVVFNSSRNTYILDSGIKPIGAQDSSNYPFNVSAALYFFGGNNDNTSIRDSNITHISVADVYFANLTSGITNLTNVTFNKDDVVKNGSSAKLYVKWYAMVYVNNTGRAPVVGATVLGNSTANTGIMRDNWQNTTNSSGLTSVAELVEYMHNSTQVYITTPHNFTATNGGRTNWTNPTINISTNRLDVFITLGAYGCQNITSNGTYTIESNVSYNLSGCCINISASDVDFNGLGFTIDGNDTTTSYGICVYNASKQLTNVTIRNVTVTDFGYGIHVRNVNNSLVERSAFNSNVNYGAILNVSARNVTVRNNTMNNNGISGFIFGNVYGAIVNNNTIQENTYADFFSWVNSLSECDNVFENNTGSGNRPLGYYNTTTTLANAAYSSLILCDAPNSVLSNITINGSDSLTNNELVLIVVNNSNFTNIKSKNNNYGSIWYSSYNNILRDSNLSVNGNNGINIYYSRYNQFINNTANYNTWSGYVLLGNSSYNQFINNTADYNGGSGYITYYENGGGNHNTFTNNSAKANTYGEIYLEGNSTNNTFINQSIDGTGSYATRISFTYTGETRIYGVTNAPSNPTGFSDINKYANITKTSGSIYLNISYTDSDVSGLDENDLEMAKYNSSWTVYATRFSNPYGVNTASNYVYANLTSIGTGVIFSPLIDTQNPTVTLSLPLNTVAKNSIPVTFQCNSTDNRGIKNVSLYTNFTGSWVQTNTTTISETISYSWNVTNSPSDGYYVWNCRACDLANNCAFSASNYTFLLDTIKPVPYFVPPTLNNNGVSYVNSTYINVSVNDTNKGSAFIDFNNSLISSWAFQESSGTTTYDNSSYGNNLTFKQNSVSVADFETGVDAWSDVNSGDGWFGPVKDCTTSKSGLCSVKMQINTSSNDEEGWINIDIYTFNAAGKKLSLFYRCDDNYLDPKAQWGVLARTSGGSGWYCIKGNGDPDCGDNDYTYDGSLTPAVICNDSWNYAEYDLDSNNMNGMYIYELKIGDDEDLNDKKGMYLYVDNFNISVDNGYAERTELGRNGRGILFDSPTEYYSNYYSDYLEKTDSSSLDLSSELTIEAWINTESKAAAGSHGTIVTKGDSSNELTVNNYALFLGDYSHTSSHILFTFYNSGWQPLLSTNEISLNTWHHVAVTMNSSRAVKLYVDGILENSATFANSPITNNYSLYVGAYPSNSHMIWPFDGKIDEVRTWKRALTAQEINASYNNGLYQLESNFTGLSDGNYSYYGFATDRAGNQNKTETRVAVVDTVGPSITLNKPKDDTGISNLSVTMNCSASDVDGLANMTLYANFSGESPWVSNGTNIVRGTSNSTTFTRTLNEGMYGWTCGANDTYGVNGTLPAGRVFIVDVTKPKIEFVSPTPPTENLTGNNFISINVSVNDTNKGSAFIDWNRTLRGYWVLEESSGTIAYDNSTWGNNLTLTNMSSGIDNGTSGRTISGRNGKGIMFDGTNDRLNKTGTSSLEITGDISFGARIYINSIVNDVSIISYAGYGETEALNALYALNLKSGGDLEYVHESGAGGNNQTTFDTNLQTETWYHVFVTRNISNNQVKLYVNGAQTGGTYTYDSDPTGGTSSYLSIGYNQGAGAYYFNGTIDEIQIHSRILSEQEINASYKNSQYRLNTNITDLGNGNYSYYALAVDRAGNTNRTETRTLIVDQNGIVYLNLPTNGSDVYGAGMKPVNVTFNCSAYDYTGLKNLSLYGNWTSWGRKNTTTITGTSNSSRWYNSLIDGAYAYNCYVCDIQNNCIFNATNYTFVTRTNPSIYFVDPTPENGSTSDSTLDINVTTEDYNLGGALIDYNYSLRGYWTFNELSGTTSYDNSTWRNNGTLTGSVVRTSGIFGNGIALNSTSGQYVIVPHHESLNPIGAITLEAWIRTNATGTILSKTNSGESPGYAFRLDSSGGDNSLVFKLNGYEISINKNVSDNQWHHVAVTYDSSEDTNNVLFYVDGQREIGEDYGGPISNVNYSLFIGRMNSSSTPKKFSGLIDEVKIYSRVLEWQEINASYNNSIYRLNTTISGLVDNRTYCFSAMATDTLGNMNKTETRCITVDLSPPYINILSPSNNSVYNTNYVWANVTLNENGSVCKYSLNGETNVSMNRDSGNYTLFTRQMSISAAGEYNITFYCSDIGGNWNQSGYRYFTINDYPIIYFVDPTDENNAAVSRNWTYVNASVTDNHNLSSCVLNWDGTNESMSVNTEHYNQTINRTIRLGAEGLSMENDNVADVTALGTSFNGSTVYMSQIKWDITDIPADSEIKEAKLCLYWNDAQGSVDDDVNYSRVDDQDWSETDIMFLWDSQILTNITESNWDNINRDSYGCVDITNVIKTDYDLENNYSSIRLTDPDYNFEPDVFTFDVLGSNLQIGGFIDVYQVLSAYSKDYMNREQMPYIDITYSEEIESKGFCYLNKSDDRGVHTYKVYANDSYGKFNVSEERTITFGDVSSECENFTVPNKFKVVVRNVESNGTCYRIFADNVTIQCESPSITINYSLLYTGNAVYSNASNSEVIGCTIVQRNSSVQNSHGINFTGKTGGLISDNAFSYIVSNNSYAVYFDNESLGSIQDNSFLSYRVSLFNKGGIYLSNNSNRNNATENALAGYNYGFYLANGSSNNTLTNNSLENNEIDTLIGEDSENNVIITDLFSSTRISINSEDLLSDLELKSSDAPSNPPIGYLALNKYINVTTTDNGKVKLRVHYSQEEISKNNLSEPSLKIWHSNHEWFTPTVNDSCGDVAPNFDDNTVDDLLGTFWMSNTHGPATSHNITYDFGSTKNVSAIRIYTDLSQTATPCGARILVSNDTITWNEIEDENFTYIPEQSWFEINFDQTEAQFMRLYLKLWNGRYCLERTALRLIYFYEFDALVGEWTELESSVNENENYVESNLTDYSVFGVFGIEGIDGPEEFNIYLTNESYLYYNVSSDTWLNWSQVATAEGYYIYYSDNITEIMDLNEFSSRDPNVTLIGSSNTTWTDEDASDFQKRYYAVAAYRGDVKGFAYDRVGKFDIELKNSVNDPSLGEGSVISLPLIPCDEDYNLSKLMNLSSDHYLDRINIYNTSTHRWCRATYATEGIWSFLTCNFTFEAGRGYWFNYNNDSYNFTNVGKVPRDNLSIEIPFADNDPENSEGTLAGWTLLSQNNLSLELNLSDTHFLDRINIYNSSTNRWCRATYARNATWAFLTCNFTFEAGRGYWFNYNNELYNWTQQRPE